MVRKSDAFLSPDCERCPVPFRFADGPADTTPSGRRMRPGRCSCTDAHPCLLSGPVHGSACEYRLCALLPHPPEAELSNNSAFTNSWRKIAITLIERECCEMGPRLQ